MKKITRIVTVLVVLMNIFVYAYADDCVHEWYEAADGYIQEYESISDEHHLFVTKVKFACKKCGMYEYRTSNTIPPVVSEHDLHYVCDSGHGTGQNHFYTYRCVLCNDYVVVTVVCNGPPCHSRIDGILLPDEEDKE